ncbi:uncharacterized protein TrAtP1_012689 [Trichoderma atroviride]|uniref:uncharacterized protein n=1 Tax=Hypocrea atroviridis TaxID=63577 RepID=UPI003321FB66|nr:hypothetical protein TrAtP1_012689 [Trichoderma atroviride]
MGFSKPPVQSLKIANKQKRKELFVAHKRASGKERHEERHRRRKEESRNPELKAARLTKNVPRTLEHKRVWDDVDDDSLGAVVDLEQLKKRRMEQVEAEERAAVEAAEKMDEDEGDDNDSMLDSDEEEDEEAREARLERQREKRAQRVPSIAPSTTSTNLDLTPTSLALKFPSLFTDEPPPRTKDPRHHLSQLHPP